MNDLVNYLDKDFGIHSSINQLAKAELTKLPLYLRASFELFKLSLLNTSVIVAVPNEEVDITPESLFKTANQLERVLNMPVIFAFDQLDSWQRKRFIDRRIGFVQLGKQLFIPQLLLSLSDIINRSRGLDKVKEKLSAPAQLAILYHLQKESLENRSFNDIAYLLRYSTMTISRLAKELSHRNLVEVIGSKEKKVKFNYDRKQLWDVCLPLFSSPVREEWFSKTPDKQNRHHFLMAGDSALEAYTMITGTGISTYAVSKEFFRSLRSHFDLDVNKNYGDCKIQSWEYDPLLLADGDCIDKLSLYLSIQRAEDERVIAALQDLINLVKW